MKPEEAQKLLGGYATGTLTDAEQRALFEAALHDQALFDALAREQPLRDLLGDPGARAHLLAALQPEPRRWWSWRPAAVVLSMAAVATVALVLARRPHSFMVPQPPRPQIAVPEVARVTPPPVAPAIPPALAVPPRPAARRRAAKPSPAEAPAPLSPPPAVLANLQSPAPPPAAAPAETKATEFRPRLGAAGAPPPAVVQAEARTTTRPEAAASPLVPAAVSAGNSMFATESGTPQLNRPLAMTGRPPTPSARLMFLGVSQRIVPGLPWARAIRYTVLRRDAAGVFVETTPANLIPGDTVELRFTANGAGRLTVGELPPVELVPMQPYTTPLLTGPLELKVIFAPPDSSSAAAAIPLTEVHGPDTYVAQRLPDPPPLTLTVKLP